MGFYFICVVAVSPAALFLGLLAVIKKRSLVEGDTAAGGTRREEALSLLVMRAGHRQALWLIHPDGDFYQGYKREETKEEDR